MGYRAANSSRNCEFLENDLATTATRADVDLTGHAAVLEFVQRVAPNTIVNCASYNDVDGAQGRQQHAFAVNAFAPRTLACAAEAVDAT